MPVSRSPVVQAIGLVRRYGAQRALAGATLDLYPSEIHALVGPAGGGKSTLIRLLAGVEQPDAGSITVAWRHVQFTEPSQAVQVGVAADTQFPPARRRVTVAESILAARPLRNALGFLRRDETRRRASEIIAEHGLALDPDARVAELSAGDRRLVGILQCLTARACVLLFDAGEAPLPPEFQAHLDARLDALRADSHGILYVPEDPLSALERADRISCLREGRVMISKVQAEWTEEKLRSCLV